MAETVHVEIAAQELVNLVGKLHQGETLTLVDSEGAPVAVLVSVRPGPVREKLAPSEWMAQWDDLSRRVGEAWQNDKSALEVLAERT